MVCGRVMACSHGKGNSDEQLWDRTVGERERVGKGREKKRHGGRILSLCNCGERMDMGPKSYPP